MNKVLLTGRLSNKPFSGKTSSNIEYSRFTLVVPRQFQSSQENQVLDFIPCVAWRYNAEFANKYLDKGSLILVEGTFQSNKIVGKDGNSNNTYSVNVDRIESLETKAMAESRRKSASQEFNIPETSQDNSLNEMKSEDSFNELDWGEDE